MQPTFQGKVQGQVLDLALSPDGTVLGPSGPVMGPVEHPRWSPTLGLFVAHEAARKPLDQPTHAGLVLKARDTGRLLLIQRSHRDEKDPARGRWEFPGGKLEDGDHNTLHGAMREWAEEVGQKVPAGGVVAHTWTSPNGVYQGHVMVVPTEDSVVLHDGRVVVNPDDPDGDDAEQAAWWEPDHARRNPALRDEVKSSPWREIKMASRYDLPRAVAAVSQWLDDDHLFHYAGDLSEYLADSDPGEFFDLAGEDTVDEDQEHALPVTYGEDLQEEPRLATASAERDPHAWLLDGGGDREVADAARAYLAKVGLRDFSRAEQQQIIDEGDGLGVLAGNADRLDLAGTHYLVEDDELGLGV